MLSKASAALGFLVLVGCGGAQAPTPDMLPTAVNPSFIGTWSGVRTISDSKSSNRDPNSRVIIVDTGEGLAQLTCSDRPLSLVGIGDVAQSEGVVQCTWPAPYPTCPRTEIYSGTLELKAGPRISIIETWDLVDCAGVRTPLRWEFQGSKDAPIPSTTPPYQQ